MRFEVVILTRPWNPAAEKSVGLSDEYPNESGKDIISDSYTTWYNTYLICVARSDTELTLQVAMSFTLKMSKLCKTCAGGHYPKSAVLHCHRGSSLLHRVEPTRLPQTQIVPILKICWWPLARLSLQRECKRIVHLLRVIRNSLIEGQATVAAWFWSNHREKNTISDQMKRLAVSWHKVRSDSVRISRTLLE